MTRSRTRVGLAIGLVTLMVAAACGAIIPGEQLGTAERPIVIAFVPSQETQKVLTSGDKIAAYLEGQLGLRFKAEVPSSYAATIEGMCSGLVDVAFLAPLSYVLAKDKQCAELLLTSVRGGQATFQGQIRVRTDSGINDICDLRGKRFAFSDPVSTSGSMYPQLLFKEKCGMASTEEFFSDVLFAGGHDKAMIALYQGQVDGAASFIDARTDVPSSAVNLFPDIAQVTKRVAITGDIPGDTVSVRPGLSADLKARIRDALLAYMETEEGKETFFGLYSIEGFAIIEDEKYDVLREGAALVGIDLETEAARTPRPPQ